MEFLKLKTLTEVEVYIGGDYEIDCESFEYKYIRISRIFSIEGEYFVEGVLWRNSHGIKLPKRIPQDSKLIFLTSNTHKLQIELLKCEVTILPKILFEQTITIPQFQNSLFATHFYNIKTKRFKKLEEDFIYCQNEKYLQLKVALDIKNSIYHKMKKLNGYQGRLTLEKCDSYFSILKMAKTWGKLSEGEKTVKIVVQENREDIDKFLGHDWDYFLVNAIKFKFISKLTLLFNKKTKNISISFLYFTSGHLFSENYRNNCFEQEIKDL